MKLRVMKLLIATTAGATMFQWFGGWGGCGGGSGGGNWLKWLGDFVGDQIWLRGVD